MKKAFAGFLTLLLCLCLCSCASSDYEYACKLERTGSFEAAARAFEKLGNYKDSADHALDCRYREADAAYTAGHYQKASELFSALGDYKDSAERGAEAVWIQPDDSFLGDWFLRQDGTQDFLADMEAAMASYPGLWDYCTYGEYELTYRLSLYEDGSFTYCLDRNSILAVADAIISATENGMSRYLTDLVTETYRSQNIPMEDVYRDLGVEDMAGVLKWLNYDASKMTEKIIQRERFEASANKATFTGTYQVTEDTLILTTAKGTDSQTYSLDDDSLTLLARAALSTLDLMGWGDGYPFVFHRQ